MMKYKFSATIKQSRFVKISWLLIRCIHSFGLVKGYNIFKQLTNSNSKFTLVEFNLPGYINKIYARPNTSDFEVFETVFISRRFNINKENIHPRLIIDAGANVGFVSIYFANKYPFATVYAIEPESSNYEALIRNTSAYGNIKPINTAIWNDNSPLNIENLTAEKWAFRVSNNNNPDKNIIKSLTVNDILEIEKCDFIDLFKIDIEGSERELFEKNYISWISKVGLFIIEFHEGLRQGCKKNFYSAINQFKYSEYTKGENHFINLMQLHPKNRIVI